MKKKVWNSEVLINLQAYYKENHRPTNFLKDSLFCYSVAVQEKSALKSTKYNLMSAEDSKFLLRYIDLVCDQTFLELKCRNSSWE